MYKKWGGGCPILSLEVAGCQNSLKIKLGVVLCLCLCLHGSIVSIAFRGLIVFGF